MAAYDVGRGRHAHTPTDIPKKGWRDVLLRVKDGLGSNHLSVIAAGVGFYALLSLFPGITAAVAIWSLTLDPQQIEQQISSIVSALPPEAAEIIVGQIRQVAGVEQSVNWTAALALLLAIYASGAAVRALIEGLNVAYGEEEKRGFVKRNLVAFLLTIGGIIMLLLSIAVIAVVPVALNTLGLNGIGPFLLSLLRWPLLFAVAIVGLAMLYRYGPCRNKAQWQWVSWGAVFATTLWIVGSVAFSIYVRQFGNYNETYGSLGAVIILLMWLWLSAFTVLIGAQINAESEHQTTRDSTRGPPKPMGERNAYVADTVGERK